MVVDGKIQLVEIFKSLNGETYNSGLPTVFVRTMGCNLKCNYGTTIGIDKLNGLCDTPESINISNYKLMYPSSEPSWNTAEEIFEIVESLEDGWKHKSVCITGGEPLLECNKDFMMNELEG